MLSLQELRDGTGYILHGSRAEQELSSRRYREVDLSGNRVSQRRFLGLHTAQCRAMAQRVTKPITGGHDSSARGHTSPLSRQHEERGGMGAFLPPPPHPTRSWKKACFLCSCVCVLALSDFAELKAQSPESQGSFCHLYYKSRSPLEDSAGSGRRLRGKGFRDPEGEWGEVPWAGEEGASGAAPWGKSKTHSQREWCCGHPEGTRPQTRHPAGQRCPQSTRAWTHAGPGPQGTTKHYPGDDVSGNQESNGSAPVFLATSFLDLRVFLGGGTVPVMTKKGFSVPLLR